MQASTQIKFQLSDELSDKSQQGHTYNDVNIATLFLVRQLEEDDGIYILSIHYVNVFKIGMVII